jgi:archaellin
VSDGINVYNSVSTSQSSTGVTEAQIRIGLAPGASPINVTNVDISAVGPGGTATGDITALSGTSVVDPADATLENSEDRVSITLDLNGTPGDASVVNLNDATSSNGLEPGQSLELTLTTSSGSQTFEVLNAPDPITGASDL